MKKYLQYGWVAILFSMGVYNLFTPSTFDKNICNLIGLLLIIFAVGMNLRKEQGNSIS